MITNFKMFEFYKGPGRAIGFKHYQEEGFGFVLIIPKEFLDQFKETQKNFVTYLKRLGLELELDVNENIPDFQIPGPLPGMVGPSIPIAAIGVEFPAVNKFEAYSIMDRIGTFFKNKKIDIIQASLVTDVKNVKTMEDQMKNSIDVTEYIYRKELGGTNIRRLGADPSKMVSKARRIGFDYGKDKE